MPADEALVMILNQKLKLLTKAAEYAFRLEDVVKGYYAQHQAAGCTCELCEKAERALHSIAHAVAGPPSSNRS